MSFVYFFYEVAEKLYILKKYTVLDSSEMEDDLTV